jgi:hypothetical protein
MAEIPDDCTEEIKRQFDQELCTNQFGCLIVNKIIDIYPK